MIVPSASFLAMGLCIQAGGARTDEARRRRLDCSHQPHQRLRSLCPRGIPLQNHHNGQLPALAQQNASAGYGTSAAGLGIGSISLMGQPSGKGSAVSIAITSSIVLGLPYRFLLMEKTPSVSFWRRWCVGFPCQTCGSGCRSICPWGCTPFFAGSSPPSLPRRNNSDLRETQAKARSRPRGRVDRERDSDHPLLRPPST